MPDDRGAPQAGSANAKIITITGSLPADWLREVETIFFEASGRSFEPGATRDEFRQRWLGRYLDAPGDPVLVALVGTTIAQAAFSCRSMWSTSVQRRR